MSVTEADPGWRGRALRFRISDVLGQIAIAIVGSCLAAYMSIYVAFELTLIAPRLLAAHSHDVCRDNCGAYLALRVSSNVGAILVSLIPNIVWSCWRRRLSLQRALLAPPIIGLAVLALTSLCFLPGGAILREIALFAPTVVAGGVIVAFTMCIWHSM